jgi:hypothetical protein
VPRRPDTSTSRVILIGTSDYEHEDDFPRLPAVHANLVGLENALTDPRLGVFARETVTVVDNPDSPASLMRRLSRVAREAEDTLLVYYAGHGAIGWDDGLFLTVRESESQQITVSGVSYELVRSAIRESPAKTRIVILDCCFSGRAIGAMSSSQAAQHGLTIDGATIITSSEPNKTSRSLPGERYTGFTGELISVLTEPSGDELSVSEIYRPLTAALAKRNLPRPKIVVGDASGELVIRRSTTPAYRGYGNYREHGVPSAPPNTYPPPQTQPASTPFAQPANLASTWAGPTIAMSTSGASAPQPEAIFPAPRYPTPPAVAQRPKPTSTAPPFPQWLRSAAWPTYITLLSFIILLFGATFAVGITQTSSPSNKQPLGPAIFAIVFVLAIAAGAAYLLIRSVRTRIRRKRKL